jgi:hypothetical protein
VQTTVSLQDGDLNEELELLAVETSKLYADNRNQSSFKYQQVLFDKLWNRVSAACWGLEWRHPYCAHLAHFTRVSPFIYRALDFGKPVSGYCSEW